MSVSHRSQPAEKDAMNREGSRKVHAATLSAAVAALFVSLLASPSFAQTQVGNYASHTTSGKSVVITGATGESIRITPYGDYIARIQVAKKGESFYADDRYEIVASHDWEGAMDVVDGDSALSLSTKAADGISISLAKQPLRLSFSIKGGATPVLAEKDGVTWSGNTVTESFSPAPMSTSPVSVTKPTDISRSSIGREPA
jgi:hypothetical protein